jgi:hypothetical protein
MYVALFSMRLEGAVSLELLIVVTTLYDFYGFKKLSDNETKKTLEKKIKNGIKQGQQHKIIPYVQMYEFEKVFLVSLSLSFLKP